MVEAWGTSVYGSPSLGQRRALLGPNSQNYLRRNTVRVTGGSGAASENLKSKWLPTSRRQSDKFKESPGVLPNSCKTPSPTSRWRRGNWRSDTQKAVKKRLSSLWLEYLYKGSLESTVATLLRSSVNTNEHGPSFQRYTISVSPHFPSSQVERSASAEFSVVCLISWIAEHVLVKLPFEIVGPSSSKLPKSPYHFRTTKQWLVLSGVPACWQKCKFCTWKSSLYQITK